MTTATGVNTTLTPYIVTQEIEPLIAFAKNVFGAEEVHRGVGSAGGIHCELRIGDSRLFFGGATPNEPVKPRKLGLHIYVDDCDAVYRRAIDAGATSVGAPQDQPYGERAAFVRDAAGNHWYIATHTAPSYMKDAPTVVPHLHFVRGASDFIAFVRAAFGATVELHVPEGERVRHAVLRIAGSPLELGEGGAAFFDAPAMFILNVDDCDAAYERALAAGATSLAAPASQTFGGRMAGVADAWGNEWYLASR